MPPPRFNPDCRRTGPPLISQCKRDCQSRFALRLRKSLVTPNLPVGGSGLPLYGGEKSAARPAVRPSKNRRGGNPMTSYLFRNVTIWDGINDAAYPGEVVVEGNRIKTLARGQQRHQRRERGGDDRRRRAVPDARHGRGPLPPLLRRPGAQPGSRRNPAGGAPAAHLPQRHAPSSNHGFTSCYSAASAKMRIDVVVRAGDRRRLSRRPALPRRRPRDHGDRRASATSASSTCTPKASA